MDKKPKTGLKIINPTVHFRDIKLKIEFHEIQIGSERVVIIPVKVWKKILSKLEDLDDIAAYDRAVKEDDGVYYTLEEVEKRIAEKAEKDRLRKQSKSTHGKRQPSK